LIFHNYTSVNEMKSILIKGILDIFLKKNAIISLNNKKDYLSRCVLDFHVFKCQIVFQIRGKGFFKTMYLREESGIHKGG